MNLTIAHKVQPGPAIVEYNERAMRVFLPSLAVLALLCGCAGVVPAPIRTAPEIEVNITDVRREPESLRGATVRWGGSIVAVRNQPNETLIEIVGRRLENDGRPRDEDRSDGRFLATASGFFDPAVYAPGREVTVRGRLEGTVEQLIGEHPYLYPLVRAEHVYLWAPRLEPLPRYPYYYYDPYWPRPWYPWGWPYPPP